jgi:hypothetical protein
MSSLQELAYLPLSSVQELETDWESFGNSDTLPLWLDSEIPAPQLISLFF